MDKLMVGVGLSGKSFIPLLSSFACAIPGIMASRVIENRRDRFVTLLIAPLMSCSARLPVYQLMTATFLPDLRYCFGLIHLRGLVIVGMYFLGIVLAMAMAWLLKKTYFRGETPPFVMELPTYKWPGWGTVLHRVWEQAWMFVQRAGTLILAVSVVVWALAYYPHQTNDSIRQLRTQETELQAALAELPQPAADAPISAEQQQLQTQLDAVEKQIAGSYLRHSYLGQMGQLLEPVVKPLGWDWRLGCAAVASFPAREVVVATLGVIYNLGEDEDEHSPVLQETLQQATWEGTDRKVFNIPVALSIMVFFALCAQCASTLVVIEKETGYWGWAVFTFVYMTGIAYIGAFVTYRVGMWLLV
jgi:ferrous iron transport protein B